MTPLSLQRMHQDPEARKRCVQKAQRRFLEHNKRVLVTVSNADYAFLSRISERSKKSVPKTLTSAALAYYRNEVIPPPELIEAFNKSVLELQRIGNNINQIAHVLHMKNNQGGGAISDDLNRSLEHVYAFQKQLKSGLYKAFESYYRKK